MFDVSSIKARSFGGAKYWLLVVDVSVQHGQIEGSIRTLPYLSLLSTL